MTTLSPMRKDETPKEYARRLTTHAGAEAKRQTDEWFRDFLDRTLRKGSYLHARVLETILARP